MVMQIFATLFMGGFIALALIGHIALFQALFFPAAAAERQEPNKPNLVSMVG